MDIVFHMLYSDKALSHIFMVGFSLCQNGSGNFRDQSEILFLISINLFLILISMLIPLSLEIVKIQNMFINQLDILLLEI